jgi:hypothetical protein
VACGSGGWIGNREKWRITGWLRRETVLAQMETSIEAVSHALSTIEQMGRSVSVKQH